MTLDEAAQGLPEDQRAEALRLAEASTALGWLPHVCVDDAGDLVAEWSTPNRRVGVIFSALPKNCGWYVATRGFSEEDGSGDDYAALDLARLRF